ncbi:MAG: asparagine synthase (glutamine-hydrolyzing) [Cryomorphaceae bacterium]
MCGIAGIYGHKNSESAQSRIRKMADKLKHRGPDAEGFHISEGIALAHRRLSIIDLRTEANQPMTDASGRYTIVFNGEIYNFRELKKRLSEYSFQTDGDTEVLLAGLAKWGISFVNECNGMFAFALWDNKAEELFLCRDRMGIKPLYYLRKDDEILFSSEIRSLISGVNAKPNLNTKALAEYFRYQTVHGPATILEGVFSLPSGSYMKITDNEQEIKHYWKLAESARTDMRGMSYEDTCAAVRVSLDASVKRRLISDVPLGVFLSGGIDSSALVALAAKHSISPIKTFNIDFQEQAFSEAKFAEQVAQKYGTEHHRIQLDPSELINQLPAAITAMDHPTGDGINSFVVSGAAKRQGITVALSGLGGDELFAGYPIFKQFHSLQSKKWLLSFPKFARDFAGSLMEMKNPGVASSKTRSVLNQDRFDLEYVYPFSREVATVGQNADMLAVSSRAESSVYNLVKSGVGYGNPGFSLPILSHVSYAELTTYLENILLRDTDQMSMAHALEVRVPFLDHELVAMVMGIGDRHKYPHSPKKLLVDAMGEDLPDSIVNRPKMGFTFPWEVWMRNELKEFCGDALQKLGARDAFNSKAIDKRWVGFLKGDSKISWSRIWHLCILEAWLDENGI